MDGSLVSRLASLEAGRTIANGDAIMLKGLWTIGVKVPDLERELEFQRAMGNQIVLDEELPLGDESYRIPLVRMGDKYLHIGEKMLYEQVLGESLPYGPVAHGVRYRRL